jgi:hypothetical protein
MRAPTSTFRQVLVKSKHKVVYLGGYGKGLVVDVKKDFVTFSPVIPSDIFFNGGWEPARKIPFSRITSIHENPRDQEDFAEILKSHGYSERAIRNFQKGGTLK